MRQIVIRFPQKAWRRVTITNTDRFLAQRKPFGESTATDPGDIGVHPLQRPEGHWEKHEIFLEMFSYSRNGMHPGICDPPAGEFGQELMRVRYTRNDWCTWESLGHCGYDSLGAAHLD